MNLPTLYKQTSSGATQMWQIAVEGSTLITTFGQKDGKLQEARDTITVGKNIGRANETTPEEQALSEAQSQWEKKQKNKGYVQSLDAALAGEIDSTFVAGGINPMLAHTFDKQGHKIKYPAYTQPKLDGHRCIAMRTDGVWTLWSRTRKPITGVPHINAALYDHLADTPGDIILDGELYNHAYREKFEELTSFIKRPEPKAGHEVVEYHIYDVVKASSNPTGSFNDRSRLLFNLAQIVDDPIQIVRTERVDSEDEAMEWFGWFSEQGYEGSMLRNVKGDYVNKRSYDLIKVKTMADSEFKIVDVTEGRGKMAGKAVFVCETPSGATFRVKMKGTLDSLRQYVDDPSLAIGRLLTVQYQNLTADGMPRFPVGLRLRDDV
jgi:DNA ligase-1